jgi:phosphocarrier protein HPr
MTNGCARARAVVANPQGLHMRPAMAFARLAQQCAGDVTVRHGERAVNGKSLIDLMMLAAEVGTELEVEVHGDGGPAALPGLVGVLEAPSADDFDPGADAAL